MDSSELKTLLKAVLDEELDWDDRVQAFRDAVDGCGEPMDEEEDEGDEEGKPMSRKGPGPGLALIFGKAKGE